MSSVNSEGGLSPKPATWSKTKRLLVPLLLAVAIALGLFGFRENQRAEALASEVASAEAQVEHLQVARTEYEELLRIDWELYAGNYRKARRMYERMAIDSGRYGYVSDQSFEVRLDHIGLLNSYAYELDTLRELAGQPPRQVFVRLPATPRPAAVAPLALEDTRPGQYDSLNFALRKAEMWIRSLEGRLRQNSGGNYLTFESARGSDVYYVGDVRDGKANGRGVALLSTGSRYQGEWRDNRRHGQGTFHWPDGAYYEGAYRDDERDGQGTYHFPDGSMFVGDWEADLRNGEGIFYDEDGEVVARGTWDDDEFVGEG